MIDKQDSIYMTLTYTKRGISIDTNNKTYMTDINSLNKLLSGEMSHIKLNRFISTPE